MLIDDYLTNGTGDYGLSRTMAHTGNYSLRVNAGKSHQVSRITDYSGITIDNSNPYLYHFTDTNRAIKPFAPTKGKYIFSGWVRENHANLNSVNSYSTAYATVRVYYSGDSVSSNIYASGVIIDGWQRMEGRFEVPAGADSIKVILRSTGSVSANFDDLRIHTYHGNMKSFVYHPVLLKVMAELDENNYATFYEYDPEGNLIRVKKETEKGIVTVQESRKSIRRTLP
jgi:hypothetical protein